MSAKVFTRKGIIAKYNLTAGEFEEIYDALLNIELLDILFSFPDGVRYDMALYMLATSR